MAAQHPRADIGRKATGRSAPAARTARSASRTPFRPCESDVDRCGGRKAHDVGRTTDRIRPLHRRGRRRERDLRRTRRGPQRLVVQERGRVRSYRAATRCARAAQRTHVGRDRGRGARGRRGARRDAAPLPRRRGPLYQRRRGGPATASRGAAEDRCGHSQPLRKPQRPTAHRHTGHRGHAQARTPRLGRVAALGPDDLDRGCHGPGTAAGIRAHRRAGRVGTGHRNAPKPSLRQRVRDRRCGRAAAAAGQAGLLRAADGCLRGGERDARTERPGAARLPSRA